MIRSYQDTTTYIALLLSERTKHLTKDMVIPDDPAFPLLRIYPKELKSGVQICI